MTDIPPDYGRLAEWNVRFLKLPADRFAEQVDEAPHESALFQLRRMLGLRGIELIVEKIETDRQLVELLEYDVTLGQGFLFGEPRPAAEA